MRDIFDEFEEKGEKRGEKRGREVGFAEGEEKALSESLVGFIRSLKKRGEDVKAIYQIVRCSRCPSLCRCDV